MKYYLYLTILTILLHFSLTKATNVQGTATLVLLENEIQNTTHSIFFDHLRQEGLQLTFKIADDPQLSLSKYSEYFYENLVVFAPSAEEFGGLITLQTIIDFIDSGRNVLFALSQEVTDLQRDIALACGMSVDEQKTSVIDHFNALVDKDDGTHTLLALPISNLISSEQIVGKPSSSRESKLLYRGVGMQMNDSNPLLIPVLHASATAYSYHPTDHLKFFPHVVGTETVLIGALQARNNARVVISGSIEFFSNEFFQTKSSPKLLTVNNKVALNIADWCFKQRGLLRVTEVKHHKKKDTHPPEAYTINDQVFYSIGIEEYIKGKWVGFTARDVQMEFHRIDPFVRLTLNNTGTGKLTANFILPDVYGVFQFKVTYNRIGFSNLYSSTQVSVRPFEHIEYERFIFSAYPYYVSAFSMMIGLLVFSFVFLHHRATEKLKAN